MRSRPPDALRRVVFCATTSACDCNSSRRSPRGSSWCWKISKPLQRRSERVAPAARKNRILVSIGASYLDIRHFPDHQDTDDLRTDRIREEFRPDRIGPEQPDILRLEDPKAEPDHQRKTTQQSG